MKSTLASLAAIALALGACRQAPAPLVPAPPVTEAEAAKLADATIVGWTSGDAARIKAMYAPSIVGFDYAVPALVTDRATWDKAQDGYATAKIDGAKQVARTIQLLGDDAFVVSGTWDVTSSTIPANNGTVRCTDVYRREVGSGWLIVNEHCSALPKPA